MDSRSACQVSFLSTKQLLRKGIAATEDSPTAAALRRAGGIPLAVTNVSELCMWMEAANPVYGRTYNPYHTGRTAGGSSGGEGALIGAAGSPFGIGSDVGGSIRYVHVRLDKSRIIWQNNLGCRHSSMGSLVTNQARVLWITVAGFPWPQAQSKSKTRSIQWLLSNIPQLLVHRTYGTPRHRPASHAANSGRRQCSTASAGE